MTKEHLNDLLQELHKELESTDAVDSENRALLAGLVADIRDVLGRPDTGASGTEESLSERLLESARDFEDSHPRLVSAIGRVADALSKSGV
jgi:hypothetical protein